jgi:hypothetical protein
MITPAFNLTATERVLPRLALDFTTASLDPRITFTRAGATATRTNSSGYVEVMAADTPRFDFNAATLACKGLLIEEARTNLFLYSQDFSQASWAKTNATVTSNAITSPSSSNDGFKLIETADTGNHQTTQSPAFTNLTNYAFSCYAKAGERTKIRLHWNGTTSALRADVDLITGQVLGGTDVTVQDAGDGWWRILKVAQRSSANALCIAILDDSGNVSYTGDPTKGLYIWGAQFELGSFATSYIPTTASQVTRTADVATMTGTNFSDWFNATEGSFAVQMQINAVPTGNRFPINITDGTANNQIAARLNTSPNFGMFVVDAGVGQVSMSSSNPVTVNTPFVGAIAYKQDSFAVARNATLSVDTLGTVPIVNQLAFQTANSSVHYQKLNYWPQRLINAEVQSFSKG